MDGKFYSHRADTSVCCNRQHRLFYFGRGWDAVKDVDYKIICFP